MTLHRRMVVVLALLASSGLHSAARAQGNSDSTGKATKPGISDSTGKATKPVISDSTGKTTKPASPAPDPKPAPAAQAAPAPTYSFAAWVFGNYSWQTDSATKSTNGGESKDKFDIQRAYLTFQGSVGNRTSFRVTTDIKQNANGAVYNGWFVRLKYGYLQYNFIQSAASSSGLNAWARIGMLHTVLIDHEETFWLRYLAQTAPERVGFFSSSDLGASTLWTLPNHLGEVYFTITNGNGYENPEADKFKDFGLRLSLTPFGNRPAAGPSGPVGAVTGAGATAGSTRPLFSTFTISPWYYAGQKASKFLVTDSITDGLKRNRYGVFVGLKDPRLTAAAEWGESVDESETGTIATRNVVSATGRLYDGFVIVRPTLWRDPARKNHNIGFVGRFDQFKPNTDNDAYQNFYIAGLFWEPTPKAAVAFDYQHQESKNYGSAAPPTQDLWYVHWTVTF